MLKRESKAKAKATVGLKTKERDNQESLGIHTLPNTKLGKSKSLSTVKKESDRVTRQDRKYQNEGRKGVATRKH